MPQRVVQANDTRLVFRVSPGLSRERADAYLRTAPQVGWCLTLTICTEVELRGRLHDLRMRGYRELSDGETIAGQ